MIRLLIFGLILQLSLGGCAQREFLNGYVVLNAGDTLSGVVKDRKEGINSKLLDRVIFKGESGRKKYRPDQLIAYHRGGSNYHSIPFSTGNDLLGVSRVKVGQRHFLQVYIDGYLSLYMDEFIDHDGPNFDGNFYLIREGELMFTQASLLFFRKNLVPYFSDAPHLAKAIEDKDYRYKDLITLVRDYNLWYDTAVKP